MGEDNLSLETIIKRYLTALITQDKKYKLK